MLAVQGDFATGVQALEAAASKSICSLGGVVSILELFAQQRYSVVSNSAIVDIVFLARKSSWTFAQSLLHTRGFSEQQWRIGLYQRAALSSVYI